MRGKSALLRGGAKLHECGSEQQNTVLVDPQRTIGAGVLFLENQPFHEVTAAPAQLFGPGDAAPSALGQACFPLAVLFKAFAGVVACQRTAWRMGL